ncbi:MAG: hypothetical protein DDT21_02300 [Syntrophomonadaceae bacterium]|nr:hypothetical protein [Bacillota bacterium]
MKFLIDDLNGETIEVDLAECWTLYPNQIDDVLYVNGVPYQLSSARSLEVEVVKEAMVIIQKLLVKIDMLHIV